MYQSTNYNVKLQTKRVFRVKLNMKLIIWDNIATLSKGTLVCSTLFTTLKNAHALGLRHTRCYHCYSVTLDTECQLHEFVELLYFIAKWHGIVWFYSCQNLAVPTCFYGRTDVTDGPVLPLIYRKLLYRVWITLPLAGLRILFLSKTILTANFNEICLVVVEDWIVIWTN